MNKNTKTAIVTGGTRGIGKAISMQLRQDGFNVISTYVTNEELAKQIEREASIRCYKCDVSNYEECFEMVENIKREFSNIDILVNNAGIIKDAMAHKMKIDDWNKVINTNLSGAFHMIRAVIEGMRDNRYGRIVSIASVNALSGCMGQANYAASKAGIIGMTKSIALENASRNITANVISPGYIKTDMTDQINEKIKTKILSGIPMERMGGVEEIAAIVSFLVSDKATYINGANINANGGQYMQ